MLEIFFSLLIPLLLIISLIEFFKTFSSEKSNHKSSDSFILVVPISGHDETAEFTLKKIIFKCRHDDLLKNKIVVCLDLNMDKETRKICDIISSNYNYVYVLTPEEFIYKLKK